MQSSVQLLKRQCWKKIRIYFCSNCLYIYTIINKLRVFFFFSVSSDRKRAKNCWEEDKKKWSWRKLIICVMNIRWVGSSLSRPIVLITAESVMVVKDCLEQEMQLMDAVLCVDSVGCYTKNAWKCRDRLCILSILHTLSH